MPPGNNIKLLITGRIEPKPYNINTLAAKIYYLHFNPLEVVCRNRDPQLEGHELIV